MGKELIMKRQYAILALFLPIAFKVSMLPAVIYASAGRDSWVTIAIFALLEVAVLGIIVGVDKVGGIQRVKEVYGTPVYLALVTPLLLNSVVKVGVYLAEVNAYISSYLFYNIPIEGVCAVFMIFTVYCATRGAKCLARLGELALWVVPVVVAVGAVFGKIDLKPYYITPVCAEGLAPVFDALQRYLFWGFDLSPLLFLRVRRDDELSKEKRTRFPWVGLSAVLYFIIIVGLYLVFIMNYGGGGHLVSFAFSSLGAFSMVNTEIGSIDWPAITLWLSVSVIAIAVKIYSGAKVLSEYKIRYDIAAPIVGMACYILTTTAFADTTKAFSFAESPARYVVTTVNVGMPVLFATLLLIAELKKHRHDTAIGTREAGNEA